MKLCAIVSGDFRLTGGMDRANYELAWHLAEREGCEVHLVSYRVQEPLASHRNVTWHRVPKPLNSYILAEPIQGCYGRRVAAELTRRGGRVIVNGGNCSWPDINWVHAVHAAWDNSDLHAPLRFRLKNTLAKWHFRRGERRSLRSAKLIITNSKRAAGDVAHRVGIASTPIRTVYYGTDPLVHRPPTPAERSDARAEFGLDEGDRLIAFVGLLGHDRNKGFDVSFDAVAQLRMRRPDRLCQVAAGDGAEVPYWRMVASRRGLTGDLKMLGMTDRIPQLLAAADLLVAPSRYEAYSLAVHEALCHGVPAVVSRIAGVSERYPPQLAPLLIDNPLSVEEVEARLSDGLDRLEQYRSETLKLSDQLRQRTWEDMAAEIVQIIRSDPTPPVTRC